MHASASKKSEPLAAVSLRRVQASQETEDGDFLAVEEPLEIRVENRPVAVVMRTPGHDRELAAGFLLSEGLLASAQDIFEISQCPSSSEGNVVNVLLARPEAFAFEKLTRHVFSNSSCGICGKASIEQLAVHFPPVGPGPRVERKVLFGLPSTLTAAQAAFQKSGGLHASAVFDESGGLVALREDVGRHNALDKILGWALLEGRLPLDRHVLLVSGRASFEIVQKAVAGGLPVIAAIGAPSSLAVETARANRQTLAGFLRDGRMNVYSHPERIT